MSRNLLKGGSKGKRVFPAEDNSPLDLQSSCSKRNKTSEATFSNIPCETDSNNEVQGKVKQILMKNFMNHSTMDIVLNPKVNFIAEQNGNGRSAIMTALTIGLGGKAITTSGDSSLREFIKHGADTADIEITLYNSAPFAQKPQEYGKEITISTTISSATGDASYKLKAGCGEIRDIEKEELKNIIWRFKIQIDNPVCILNHDTADKLLNRRDPEELFGLFLKATSTVALAEACDYVLGRLYSEIARIIPQIKDLEFTTNEIVQWERKQKLSLSVEVYKQRKSSLQIELQWAVAYQMRKEYKKLKDKMEEQHTLCPKLLAEVEKQQNEVISIKSSLRELDEELITLQRQCSEAEENFKRTQQDACLKKAEYDPTFRTIEILKEQIIRTQDLAQFYESELHKQTLTPKESAARKKRVEEMKKEHMKLVALINTCKRHRINLSEDYHKTTVEAKGLTMELQKLTNTIEKQKHEIAEMQSGSSTSITIFGSKIPQVLQKIDEAHQHGKFCRKPIGPLGAFITLKDETWTSAVESVTSSILDSFCVDSVDDSERLHTIFEEVYDMDRKPPVIISKFFDKVHDVSQHAIKCQKYSNMLDMLIVDNPVVANCIIDQLEVERILLIPTREEAYKIMNDASTVPPNCYYAITKESHIFFPDGSENSYPRDDNESTKLRQGNKQEAIKVANLTLRELLRQRTMVKKDLKAVKKRNKNAKRELSQSDKEIIKLRKDHYTFFRQLVHLMDSIEPVTLREKSNECKKLLASKTTEYDQLQEKLKELASEQETLTSKCEELTNIVAGFKIKRQAMLMQKMKLHRELERSEFEKEKHEKNYHDQCNRVHQLQKDLKMMHEGVKKAFNETMPPAICSERSRDEIEMELNALTTYIESAQHVTEMYLEKKKEHDMLKEVVSIMKKNLKVLELIVKLRSDNYTNQLRQVTAAVQHEFQLLLDKRNLKGNVIIDIRKRTLQLAAQFSSSDGHTDGEISYLAVILIMSLWNFMGSPIYVLNEVDACMPEGYRKEMMDLLVAHAEEAQEHQFIFLTQQDTSNVSPE